MLQFPRLLLERSAKQPLELRNEGILPATVRVSVPRGTPFSCSASGQLIAIEPQSSYTLDVGFTAGAPGEQTATLSLAVLKNAFEDQTVELRGLAYAHDVAIEDLPAAEEPTGDEPADDADRLKFGDVAMGQSKTISFTAQPLQHRAQVQLDERRRPHLLSRGGAPAPQVGQGRQCDLRADRGDEP